MYLNKSSLLTHETTIVTVAFDTQQRLINVDPTIIIFLKYTNTDLYISINN